MSETTASMGSTVLSVVVGVVAPPVGAILSVVGGFKSWMDHTQVEFQRDELSRYIDNMRLQSALGKQDALKMEIIRRYTEGGDGRAYFKVKDHGGVAWMDNLPDGARYQPLYWHPNERFAPQRAIYLYVKDPTIKYYGARRVPSSQGHK